MYFSAPFNLVLFNLVSVQLKFSWFPLENIIIGHPNDTLMFHLEY